MFKLHSYFCQKNTWHSQVESLRNGSTLFIGNYSRKLSTTNGTDTLLKPHLQNFIALVSLLPLHAPSSSQCSPKTKPD